MRKHVTVFLASLGMLVASTVLGGDEPPVRGEGRALPYLQALHAKVHRVWTDSFLTMAEGQLPKDHPINLPSRAVELEVVLTADGKLSEVEVAKPSREADFDKSALDVMKAAAPFLVAPEEALSDDGKVHVRWMLARDDRRCSGVSVEIKTRPLEEAVPMLVASGRESVAIARMQAAEEKDRHAAFAALARAWLDRYEDDKELSLQVAEANALAGDPRGADRLRRAVEDAGSPPGTAQSIAQGLATLKVPVCPLIKESVAKKLVAENVTPSSTIPDLDDTELVKRLKRLETRERILNLLSEGSDGPCLSFAIALAKDRSARPVDRALALWGLGRSDRAEAKTAVRALLSDGEPTVKSAAIWADARQEKGKGAVFRLIPYLRDRSSEVRAAAAAALVRVGGEEVLPQLFQVWREKDSSIYVALALELADLSGEASADMLLRLLRKEDRRVRVAAARALAARQDETAAKGLPELAKAQDAEIKLLAGPALGSEDRLAAAAAPEGYTWAESFLALARGKGKLAAVDWALAQFPKIDPATRIYLMGTWLVATRPKN
jgi:TonB family protein